MEIVIQSRAATLAEDFSTIAREKLETMNRFSVKIERIEVEIIHEQNPRQGKKGHRVTLSAHGAGPAIRAEGAEFNDVAAFDAAIKSFELQIRKIHERNKDIDRKSLRDLKSDI